MHCIISWSCDLVPRPKGYVSQPGVGEHRQENICLQWTHTRFTHRAWVGAYLHLLLLFKVLWRSSVLSQAETLCCTVCYFRTMTCHVMLCQQCAVLCFSPHLQCFSVAGASLQICGWKPHSDADLWEGERLIPTWPCLSFLSLLSCSTSDECCSYEIYTKLEQGGKLSVLLLADETKTWNVSYALCDFMIMRPFLHPKWYLS